MRKRRKSFLFLFVTNTFEMQIILCNILKGWGQTTKYIRWPQRIITTYTPSSLCLECIRGECSCIHCKIASFESAFYSFHLQILLLNLRHLSNKNEKGLSGLPFDKTKNMINNRVHCYLKCSLRCTSAFKHFRTDIFILWTENNKELPVNWN